MPTWPASLPSPIINSFNETAPENTIRTQMDVGPAKVRRRTTANVRKVSFQMILTPAQLATLDDFFVDDTLGGAASFDYTHPRTAAAVSARFESPPQYTDINGLNYTVDVALEVLP